MSKIIRIGMDTSKHFFQLHGVDADEQVVLRKKLTGAMRSRVSHCAAPGGSRAARLTSNSLATMTRRWRQRCALPR